MSKIYWHHDNFVFIKVYTQLIADIKVLYENKGVKIIVYL